MKYIRKVKSGGTTKWVFYPPTDVAKARVLTKRTFTSRKAAMRASEGLVRAVERYRRGEIPGKTLNPSNTLAQSVSVYKSSPRLRSLPASTVNDYSKTLDRVCNTDLGNMTFGNVKLHNIKPQMCEYVYSIWLKEFSVYKSNRMKLLFGMLMSYLMGLDVMQRNPMQSVKAAEHTPKSLVWTEEQVEKFLDVAFSDFKWRGVGLGVLMMYSWAQRPKDILRLKWSDLDLENSVVTITQTKRGATVRLPIDDNLRDMLIKQKDDYDFQEYVIPTLSPDKRYVPYQKRTFSSQVKKVLEIADLPEELSSGYLRKSAIMDMVESGVDSTQIMSVTGHKNLSSLNPYMKHTLKAATEALSKRNYTRTVEQKE